MRAPARQTQRRGHVRKIAEVAMGFHIHALAAKLRRLVRQVIERLRPQVVEPFGVELARIIDRGPLVIDAFELW